MTVRKRFWIQQTIIASTLLLLVLILLATSCESDSVPTLHGTWVEVGTRSDTIVFGFMGPDRTLTLLRGTEEVDGQWIRKSSGGAYYYKVTEAGISLHWVASSNVTWNEYQFRQLGKRLTIGNFYDQLTLGEPVEYERID